MKLITSVFTFTAILLFISCTQPKEPKAASINKSDTTRNLTSRKEAEIQEQRTKIQAQEKLDSINDQKVLIEALQIARKSEGKAIFKKTYMAIPDSFYQVDVDISSGFYFSGALPHLIIKRKTPAYDYIDIFSKNNSQYQKVVSHKQWAMEYIGDTIRDINGDGLKDFVVNWYGSTGCCLKAFSNVYLQRAEAKTFSESFEFINPTFSPKEKMIRGVCYGHPGETEIYKYQWNKETIDTVEYVYYEKNDQGDKTGKILVSSDKNHKVLRRLDAIPAEYQKIYGYDWFIDNLKENDTQ